MKGSSNRFGDTIRMARLTRRWSQAYLARIVRLADQSLISRLEHGRIADPSARLVKHLAVALQLDANDLIQILAEDKGW